MTAPVNAKPILRRVLFAPTPDEPIVEHAVYYATCNGWSVFPAPPGTKKSHKSAEHSGGRPWGATTDVDELRRDFKKWPDANVGVVTGAVSGIFVVETDTKEGHDVDGTASLAALEAANGTLPATLQAISPSGSVHYYFKHPGFKIKNSASEVAPGVDVRGDGGMVIATPSVRPGKGVYSWRNNLPIADAPKWLLDRIEAGKEKPEPERTISQPAKDTVRPPVDEYAAYGAEWTHRGGGGGYSRAYLDKALANERAIVAATGKNKRNNQLNKSSFALGQLVAHGLTEKEVIDAMHDAAIACGYVEDDGRKQTMDTINSGLRDGIADPRPAPQPKPTGGPESADNVIPLHNVGVPKPPAPPPIHATPYAWTDPATIPQREWLYGKLLLRKFVSSTISPGGIGKSSLVTAEALAMVSGKDLLGIEPGARLRVWLWNLEDPLDETKRKIQAAALHYELEPEDIGDRLMVDSGREQRLVIATAGRNGAVIVQPVVDSLVEEIIKHQIDVIIIDPFVSCHEVVENDNAAMDMVVKEWGRVADRGNCAVMLIHHTRKMGGTDAEVTTESSRGGSSQTDACRVVRTINRMTKDQAANIGIDNPGFYFRTINGKPNLEPPADKSDWYKLVSVDLGNGPMGTGDSVGVVTKWEFPEALAGMTAADFDRVAIVIRGGKWRFDPQAKDWVGKAVAEALNLDIDDRPTRGRIRRILGVWTRPSRWWWSTGSMTSGSSNSSSRWAGND